MEIWGAADKPHAFAAVNAFEAAHGAKFPKAAAKITDDMEELLAFYDYPCEHWVLLRTSSAAERARPSTVAVVPLGAVGDGLVPRWRLLRRTKRRGPCPRVTRCRVAPLARRIYRLQAMTKVIGGRRHVHLPGYGPEREDLTIGLAARSGPDGQAGGKVEPRMTIRWPGAGCNSLPPRALTPFFLAPPSFRPLAWWRLVPRPEVVVSLASSARSSLPMRLTATGVIGYCLIFPLGQLGLITANTAGLRQAGWAWRPPSPTRRFTSGMSCTSSKGRHRRRQAWTLAAMAAIIGGAAPLAGSEWLPSFFALTVSLLITAPWRWSLPGVAVLAAAQVPLVLALGTPSSQRRPLTSR